MAKFIHDILLDMNLRNTITSTLGTESQNYSDNDRNKVVKRSDTGSMVLCAEGDEIEGFIESTELATSDGLTVASVVLHAPIARNWVYGENLNVGDLVVAGAQTPPTQKNVQMNHPKNAYGTTVVKKGSPVNFKWRVLAKNVRDPNLVLIEAV